MFFYKVCENIFGGNLITSRKILKIGSKLQEHGYDKCHQDWLSENFGRSKMNVSTWETLFSGLPRSSRYTNDFCHFWNFHYNGKNWRLTTPWSLFVALKFYMF